MILAFLFFLWLTASFLFYSPAPALLCPPRDLLRLNKISSLRKSLCATYFTGVLRKALGKNETEPSKPWPQVFLFSSGWPCSNPGVTIHTRARSKEPWSGAAQTYKVSCPTKANTSCNPFMSISSRVPKTNMPVIRLMDSEKPRKLRPPSDT